MDTALIVFAVGTAASFLPIYWITMRLMSRQRRPATPRRAEDSTGRREFIDLLRREAAIRAVAVLHEALAEARLAADEPSVGGPLSVQMQTSLDETRRLVESLFPRELCQVFREGAAAASASSPSSVGSAAATITAAIGAFEPWKDAEGIARMPRRPRSGPSGSRARRRDGWQIAGGFRTAA